MAYFVGDGNQCQAFSLKGCVVHIAANIDGVFHWLVKSLAAGAVEPVTFFDNEVIKGLILGCNHTLHHVNGIELGVSVASP